MSSLSVSRIDPIDIPKIRSVLAAQNISETTKVEFLKTNNKEIKSAFKTIMTSEEYSILMQGRPLEKFKPVKNSFTKRGDKILLAKALDIQTSEVNSTIESVYNSMIQNGNIELSRDKINLLRSYVYRHGTKDQVVAFLGDELSHTKDILQLLYRTLQYDTNGVADYFLRPIHRLDNKTLVKIYKTVDENLVQAKNEGKITEMDELKTSELVLKRIYLIQNNSRLLGAIKTYKTLK